MESRKNSSSIPFVIPWQWVHLIIIMIFFLSLSLNIEPSHLFCQMNFHLLPLFLKKSVLWKGAHSSTAAGPRRLPAKGSFRQSWSCSRERLSASSFCLLPGGFPFWAHLGLSLKGTLKIQDSVFITRTHLLNMRLPPGVIYQPIS